MAGLNISSPFSFIYAGASPTPLLTVLISPAIAVVTSRGALAAEAGLTSAVFHVGVRSGFGSCITNCFLKPNTFPPPRTYWVKILNNYSTFR